MKRDSNARLKLNDHDFKRILYDLEFWSKAKGELTEKAEAMPKVKAKAKAKAKEKAKVKEKANANANAKVYIW